MSLCNEYCDLLKLHTVISDDNDDSGEAQALNIINIRYMYEAFSDADEYNSSDDKCYESMI